MENGDIDLLIIPAQYVSPNHPSGALYEETCVCVTWKGKRRIRRMSVEEYSAAEHVATHFGGGRMPAFDSWIMERHGISRRSRFPTWSNRCNGTGCAGRTRCWRGCAESSSTSPR